MQIQHLYIQNYKNLNEFVWDITSEEISQIMCIVGENGAGKSNLLEAIIHIFKCLNFSEKITPLFSFSIKYKIENSIIQISGIKSKKNGYTVLIDNESVSFERIIQISKTWIYPKNADKLEGILPENIIVYYSGYSKRIDNVFSNINKIYEPIFRQGKSLSLPPIMQIKPFHFKLILLALFSFDKAIEYIHIDFLKNYFNIAEFHSVHIHIKKYTNWTRDKEFKNQFDSKGINRSFLIGLNEVQKKENKTTKSNYPYLIRSKQNSSLVNRVEYFLKDQESLVELKNSFGTEVGLFKVLNVLNQAGYLAEICIFIKKEGVDDPINFDSLSEGEQQLLAIKGCIELLRGKSNLFLWDEPDTYLNPRWQWSLIPELEKQIDDNTEDQFLITSHSPVLLSTIKKGAYEMNDGVISSLFGVYGLSVNETLNKQEISNQLDAIKDKYEKYLLLIQQGKGKEETSNNLRKEIIEKWGENNPNIVLADLYLKYFTK